MNQKKVKRTFSNMDNCAYPYLYEDSMKVDHELITDKIACHIGFLSSLIKNKNLYQDLIWFCELTWDINGSIRGKNIITKAKYNKVYKKYKTYQDNLKINFKHFILPIGSTEVCVAEIIRSLFKEAIRTLHQLDKHEPNLNINPIIFDTLNLLSNTFNLIALNLRQEKKEKIIVFKSKSY